MNIYVDAHAALNGDGSKDRPFRKIQEAADVAQAGDTVLVSPGEYHEDVDPRYGGTERSPIVYRSVIPKAAVITAKDRFTGWTHYEGAVWQLVLPNTLFSHDHPYKTLVFGDWLNQDVPKHTGEVFMNGRAFYEKESLAQVLSPVYSEASWDRDFSLHTWYTCQSDQRDETIIYANFCGADPNAEITELSMRSHCFYPSKMHLDYITLDGFTVTGAACQWAPPTALQEGMIGPHWAKGWIIENCEISHAKCSGISLGKYYQPENDNKWTRKKLKDGAQNQRDCSLIAQIDGWSKETIGSHIVRHCEIHDCGQTGIVGNLGCVFSVIEDNHIHHINNKRDLAGAEIGGIKFHAAIDVIIRRNHFHHCTRGVWLDWQTQGTRVSANLFHDNCMPYDHLLKAENKAGLGMGEDLFIEIAHGPCLVDNNILLSERAVKLPTQGVAFVHNLICGAITAVNRGAKNGSLHYDSTRYTPIHRPHRTEITGFMSIVHGDVRFYNNVFIQQPVRPGLAAICADDHEWDDENLIAGTLTFNGFMTEAEWLSHFDGYCGEGAENPRDKYYMPLPVWAAGNAYFGGARPCEIDAGSQVDESHPVNVCLKEGPEGPTVESDYMAYLQEVSLISSETLGMAFEPEQRFENPDGSDIVFDTDILGHKRAGRILPGPFAL